VFELTTPIRRDRQRSGADEHFERLSLAEDQDQIVSAFNGSFGAPKAL
jgi:hypothetical protein